jgi:hypothetical protein
MSTNNALEMGEPTLAQAARKVREAIEGGHDPFRLAVNAASRKINCDDHVASVSCIALALEDAMRALEGLKA